MSEATMRRDRAVTMSLVNLCPDIRRELSSAQQLELLARCGSNWSPEHIAVTQGLQEFIEGRISEGDLRSLAESLDPAGGSVQTGWGLVCPGPTFWRSWVDDFLRDNGARYFPVFSRGLRPSRSCWGRGSDFAWLKFVKLGSDLLVALALARTRKKGRFAQLKALVLTENGASILAAVRMARALDLLPQMSVEARQLGLEKIT